MTCHRHVIVLFKYKNKQCLLLQAIDHLEQQERRNSQDQQNVAEEVTLS